jgi:tRNA-dihydrouridine synthase
MVKHAVHIPVFGSGNILTPQLARYMLTETDCDGVLAARGAFGNPWLLRDIEHYLRHSVLPEPPGIAVRKQATLHHLAYLEQYKVCTPRGKVGVMRKITLWYLKGFPGASHLRGQVSTLPNYEALVQFVETHLAKEQV